MSLIKPEDVLKDNDPRSHGARVRVVEIQGDKAIVESIHGGRRRTLLLRRIFADGKSRRTGYSLVKE